MKLFGKRKKASEEGVQSNPSTPTTTNTSSTSTTTHHHANHIQHSKESEEDINVSSYFSADFVPPSQTDDKETVKEEKKEHDIEELLNMDHKDLNAKQRRVLKRYHERGSTTETITDPAPDPDTDTANSTPTAAIFSKQKGKEEEETPKEESESSSEESDSSDEEEESTEMAIDVEQEAVAVPAPTPTPVAVPVETPVETDTLKEEQEEKIEEEKKVTAAAATATATKELLSIEEIAEQLRAVNSKERRKLLRTLAVDYDADFLVKATEASKQAVVVVAVAVDAPVAVAEAIDEPMDPQVLEVANQLKNLNSKERRKLLRQLASQYDAEFLEQVTDFSKKIAEENELKQVQEQEKSAATATATGATVNDSGKRKAGEMTGSTDADGGKKKTKLKDLSHLPPDERARREKQREMQQEAADRRAAGDVLTRHPLNSERRRANRRKPGRAGKIAKMKKESKEKQQSGNVSLTHDSSGYTMRHVKKGGRD